MSKLNDSLSVCPDDTMRSLSNEEFISKGYPCPYCHGEGCFHKEDNTGEWIKTKCPLCGGNKELEAVVTVRWRIKENKSHE